MIKKDITEFEEFFIKVNSVQEGQDLSCSCTECYWNMYHPSSSKFNNESDKTCVSESLGEFKMKPSSPECPGFWDYKEACGHKKEEISFG